MTDKPICNWPGCGAEKEWVERLSAWSCPNIRLHEKIYSPPDKQICDYPGCGVEMIWRNAGHAVSGEPPICPNAAQHGKPEPLTEESATIALTAAADADGTGSRPEVESLTDEDMEHYQALAENYQENEVRLPRKTFTRFVATIQADRAKIAELEAQIKPSRNLAATTVKESAVIGDLHDMEMAVIIRQRDQAQADNAVMKKEKKVLHEDLRGLAIAPCGDDAIGNDSPLECVLCEGEWDPCEPERHFADALPNAQGIKEPCHAAPMEE